jgi:hypothetical protein
MRKESFFPIYCDVLVPFDIFMPSRLQQKYSSTIPVVETFRVKLMYDDGMPVVDINYTVDVGKNQARMFSPSTAIVFVRKYLEDKLKDHPTIEFQTLGH